jgi:DNA-binding transcriptional regulator YhcF (GntR family)
VDISINIDDPEPLFAQLISQIKAAVQGGKLRAGDALPSITAIALRTYRIMPCVKPEPPTRRSASPSTKS